MIQRQHHRSIRNLFQAIDLGMKQKIDKRLEKDPQQTIRKLRSVGIFFDKLFFFYDFSRFFTDHGFILLL